MKLFAIQVQGDAPLNYTDNDGLYGISFQYPVSACFGGLTGEWNDSFLPYIKNDIKGAKAKGKKAGIGIVWGWYANNINEFRYVSLTEKGHENRQGDKPVPMKVPVPYDIQFIDKQLSFLTWLSKALKADKDVWDTIEFISVSGINQQYMELRIPDQDFSFSRDPDPFISAAMLWKEMGYSNLLVKETVDIIASYYKMFFPDKTLVLPIIGGKAGFPCIDNSGNICKPSYRPALTEEIINEIAIPNKIMPGWYALKETNSPPDYFNGLPCFLESENTMPATYGDLQKRIANAQSFNADYFEIQRLIYKKYPQVSI